MQLNFKTFGQGDPLIILHGLFGTLDNWQTVARQLAERYSVYLVDQRNHGRSPHCDEMSYPLMAEDLLVFMESQWIYKAHILGHSMGGKTAMQFALQNSDMVDHLIIVDIAPKVYSAHHDLIFDALFSVDLEKLQSRKEADEVLEAKVDDFAVRQFLLKNLSRTKEGGYRWKMNLPVLHKYYDRILDSIRPTEPIENPTLFIKGANSDYIQENDKTLIEQYFAKAEVKTVADAGHWVHAEQPEALLNLVKEFLPE